MLQPVKSQSNCRAIVVRPCRQKGTPSVTVLMGRHRKGTEKSGFWGFPGGGLEEGESALACQWRETQEEVGEEYARHFRPLSPDQIRIKINGTGRLMLFGLFLAPPNVPDKLPDTEDFAELAFREVRKCLALSSGMLPAEQEGLERFVESWCSRPGQGLLLPDYPWRRAGYASVAAAEREALRLVELT